MEAPIRPHLNQQLAASGQTSQDYANALAQQMASIGGIGANYNTGINQYLAALGQSGSAYNSALANQQASLGGMSNAFNTGIANQQNIAQSMSAPYQAELNRMLAYTQNAPALANQDYMDISQLAASGDAQRAYEQQLLSAPYQQMLQFGQLIQPGTAVRNADGNTAVI